MVSGARGGWLPTLDASYLATMVAAMSRQVTPVQPLLVATPHHIPLNAPLLLLQPPAVSSSLGSPGWLQPASDNTGGKVSIELSASAVKVPTCPLASKVTHSHCGRPRLACLLFAVFPFHNRSKLHPCFIPFCCFFAVATGPPGTYSSNSPASPLSSASLTSPLSPFSLVSGSQGSPTKQGAGEVSGAARAWG